MAVDKTIAQYKTLEQLQEYAMAQQTTITQLSKKLQRLEEENRQLKQNTNSNIIELPNKSAPDSNQEQICTMEIQKLHQLSMQRELTYEEAKKFELYSKVLQQINANKKQKERQVNEIPEQELLAAAESNDGN